MSRPALEVADILRDHGAAWRRANAGHVSLGQLKVMSAIERCRTAALGGHVARCENETCAHTVIAYNSCRNRHCPKCQGAAAREWLAEREADLLPVPYFHVVYTLPAQIADIAYQNKAVIYDLLFKASAETTLTIAADPKHLGARIGFMSVLHTWGSALTHHPHVHMVVPGGGLSPDGSTWIACRPRYFVTVEVLSALFRRLFLQMLVAAHHAGHLQFFGDHVRLADKAAFKASAETMLTIAADPKHLGARIAITSVLHTWGSAITHHPHVHMIVPGGGLSPDGERWIAARPNFLPAGAGALQAVPAPDAGQAGRRAHGRQAGLLRRACPPGRRQGLRRLPGAAEENEVVRLLQAPVRRAQGCVGLPIALHPPRRHLQPAPDRSR